MENLGLIAQEPRSEFDDPGGYGLKISNLVGPEVLEELPEALDKPVFLFTRVVVGPAQLEENLVIWKVGGGKESAIMGGFEMID